MKIKGVRKDLWVDLLKNKKNPEAVIRQAYMPSPTITRLLAEEAISSIRGGVKHKFSVSRKNGRLTVARFRNGSYPYGIMKRKSPDGTNFEPLSKTTLEIRRMNKNSRGKTFILRETGKHIMNGLHVKSLSNTAKGSKAVIGWSGNDEKIAIMQNQGFNEQYDVYGRPIAQHNQGYKITVPARPFIGIQEELKNVLSTFWKKITRV